MQMYGSKASKLDRVAKGTGLGVLAGLTLLAVTQTACQPGSLQCDDRPNCEDWKGNAGGAGGGGDGEGGSGGSTPITRMDAGGGGSGGGAGGMGGSAGGGGGVSASTALTGCSLYNTVGDLEDKLLKVKCGTGCHTAAAASIGPTDMLTPEIWKRFVDVSPKKHCTNAKLVNKSKPAESVLLLMLESKPMCPDGTDPKATQMPPGGATPAEKECIKAYVQAIAK